MEHAGVRLGFRLTFTTDNGFTKTYSGIAPMTIGLRGSALQFHPSITNKERSMQALSRINLPGIQNALEKMTGYIPTNMPQTTMLHAAADLNATQAAIVAKGYTPLSHDPQSKHLRFRFK